MSTMGLNSPFVEAAAKQFQETSVGTLALLTTTVLLTVTYAFTKLLCSSPGKKPPHIPSRIPFLGQAIDFGQNPVTFLLAAEKKYGPVFSFTMMGKTFTYLVGAKASALFFNSRNEQLNAELVYGKLTTPVFGKGVAYDCPNSLFLEQKKMFKTGFNIARYRAHIPMIEHETEDFMASWGDKGQLNIFETMAALIILTSSRCLHGKEIRSMLTADVAKLYWDLDGGFSAAAWLLPSWVPLPSFRRRDEAHIKVKQIFYEAIKKRRESGDIEEDMLQTLLDSTYKCGRHMTDDEIAGMLIGLLLAGQHTSSTTSSWMLFFLAQHQDIQDATFAEQKRVFGDQLLPPDYDGLKECVLLDRCMKEALRLRPPLFTMMRLAMSPQHILGYTIPAGHQVCVSPPANMCLESVWDNANDFIPDRFLDPAKVASDEKFNYIPFGAGRHRCIGESFAYVQVKAIMSCLLRKYRFRLTDAGFPDIDRSTMIQTPKDPIIIYELRQ